MTEEQTFIHVDIPITRSLAEKILDPSRPSNVELRRWAMERWGCMALEALRQEIKA